MTGVIAFVFIAYANLVEKRSLKTFGLVNKKIEPYKIGVMIGELAIVSIVVLNWLFKTISFRFNTNFDMIEFAILGLGFIIQGFSEEIIFRGYLFNGLSTKLSVLSSIFLSSIFFAILHVMNNFTIIGFFNIFLFSVWCSLDYYFNQNIYRVSAIHAIWNFTLSVILGSSLSGIKFNGTLFNYTIQNLKLNILSGGINGIENGFITTGILVAIILVLIFKKIFS